MDKKDEKIKELELMSVFLLNTIIDAYKKGFDEGKRQLIEQIQHNKLN